MRKLWLAAAGLFLCTFGPTWSAADANSGSEPPYRVGYRIVHATRPDGSQMTVCLWYPTEVGPGRLFYPLPGPPMPSDAVRDAPPARGPFPLVVFSHGGGGCAVTGATLAEALAEWGFVVAAPDHDDEFRVCNSDAPAPPPPERVAQWIEWARGKSRAKYQRSGVGRFAHRPREVSLTIDRLLELSADPENPFRGLVDPERIGMMGVSFGAWTTMAVAGYYPTAFRDGRVKAALPIAGTPGMPLGGVENIHVPLMLIFGEQETMALLDPSTPRKTEGMLADFERANPPKFLVGISRARHLEFGGAGAARRLGHLRGLTTRQVRRSDHVVGTVNHYAIAFFRRYLKGESDADAVLTHPFEHVFLLKADLGPPATLPEKGAK